MSLTLFTITNIETELTEFALEKTHQSIPANKTVVISPQPLNLSFPAEHRELHTPFGMLEYCDFCLKGMSEHISTDFVMIAHYDGMATNPTQWTNEYFDYDYVGSVSHPSFPPMQASLQKSGLYPQHKTAHWFTCGGGLSLRSKRLLSILAEDPKIQTLNQQPGFETPFISEDAVITLLNREYLESKYQIRFAPLHISLKFCAEVLTGYTHALGFHGWYNAPLYLTEAECLYYFQRLKKIDYARDNMQMQLCKFHTMMRGYMNLREYLISTGKWTIY